MGLASKRRPSGFDLRDLEGHHTQWRSSNMGVRWLVGRKLERARGLQPVLANLIAQQLRTRTSSPPNHCYGRHTIVRSRQPSAPAFRFDRPLVYSSLLYAMALPSRLK